MRQAIVMRVFFPPGAWVLATCLARSSFGAECDGTWPARTRGRGPVSERVKSMFCFAEWPILLGLNVFFRLDMYRHVYRHVNRTHIFYISLVV